MDYIVCFKFDHQIGILELFENGKTQLENEFANMLAKNDIEAINKLEINMLGIILKDFGNNEIYIHTVYHGSKVKLENKQYFVDTQYAAVSIKENKYHISIGIHYDNYKLLQNIYDILPDCKVLDLDIRGQLEHAKPIKLIEKNIRVLCKNDNHLSTWLTHLNLLGRNTNIYILRITLNSISILNAIPNTVEKLHLTCDLNTVKSTMNHFKRFTRLKEFTLVVVNWHAFFNSSGFTNLLRPLIHIKLEKLVIYGPVDPMMLYNIDSLRELYIMENVSKNYTPLPEHLLVTNKNLIGGFIKTTRSSSGTNLTTVDNGEYADKHFLMNIVNKYNFFIVI